MTKEKRIQEEIRKLAIERIKASSGELVVSVGAKDYTKSELLESVKKGSKIGKEVMEAQIGYVRDMAEGKIYQNV
jgi:hypothetical protein